VFPFSEKNEQQEEEHKQDKQKEENHDKVEGTEQVQQKGYDTAAEVKPQQSLLTKTLQHQRMTIKQTIRYRKDRLMERT